MSEVTGDWSRDELEVFLNDSLLPIRLGCHHSQNGLWMLSLWYDYRDDHFLCATGRNSDVASFLRKNEEVCFEVSTNRPPYMGVRGNGTARLESDEDKALLKSLLDRYLGGRESALAKRLLSRGREELRIVVEPARLFTWDFTDRMDQLAEVPAATAPGPSSPTSRD